jgi:MFS family permease
VVDRRPRPRGPGAYRRVLRCRGVLPVLLVGLALRVPYYAATFAAILHVVNDLNRSYAWAGLVTAVLAVSTALVGPQRGRALGKRGLRTTLISPLIALTLVGLVAPWVGFWPFVGLVAALGAFALPTFAVARGALTAAVDADLRPTALALDAMAAEVGYIIGPLVGITLATQIGAQGALAGLVVRLSCGRSPALAAEPDAGPPAPDGCRGSRTRGAQSRPPTSVGLDRNRDGVRRSSRS